MNRVNRHVRKVKVRWKTHTHIILINLNKKQKKTVEKTKNIKHINIKTQTNYAELKTKRKKIR